jgi:RNA polymerase sigma-70 factor, ECF subfamily
MKHDTATLIDLAEPLRRFVRRRVKDAHEADDIVQDVLLKALANSNAVPPDERRAAWMFRAARNVIVDRYRAHNVRKIIGTDALEATADDDVDEQANVVAELAGCLRGMIDRLDAPYRQALQLDYQGHSQQQIADVLKLSLSGAKSRVQRARQQLHAVFAACCNVAKDARGNVIDYQPNDPARQQCDAAGCDPDRSACG